MGDMNPDTFMFCYPKKELLPGLPAALDTSRGSLVTRPRQSATTRKFATRWVVPNVCGKCRYIDSNNVNALSPHDMASDRLRRSVLGALRHGKPLVLDLMEVDVWGAMKDTFDAVQPGVLELLTSGDIIHEVHYSKLVRPGDGPEYQLGQFTEDRLALFRFVVATSLKFPDEGLMAAPEVYRVKAEG